MSAIPAREGVGAEAGVHHRDGALHVGVAEFGIELLDLLRVEHSFIDNRAGRKARHVEVAAAKQAGSEADALENTAADDVELALELDIRHVVVAATNENLLDHRLLRAGGLAEGRVVGRHLAEAEILLTFGLHHLTADILDGAALREIGRKKNHADAVLARRGQLDISLGARFTHELVGNLHQNTGAVTGVLLVTGGSTVLHVHQNLQALLDDLMRLDTLDIGYEANAAGIMLELWIVQAPFMLCFHIFRHINSEKFKNTGLSLCKGQNIRY